MKNNSTDITLTYIDPTNSINPNVAYVYTGAWTKRGVIGWGVCSDADSGCSTDNATTGVSPYIRSLPLRHKQATFSYDTITSTGNLTDKVNNSTGMLFDSTVRNITDVKRSCYYQLSTDKIDAYMDPTANPATGYIPSQATTLLAIKAAISANSFNATYIQTLLAMKGDINTGTSPLFTGPTNCRYTSTFDLQ